MEIVKRKLLSPTVTGTHLSTLRVPNTPLFYIYEHIFIRHHSSFDNQKFTFESNPEKIDYYIEKLKP
jgi:hypothetical protein